MKKRSKNAMKIILIIVYLMLTVSGLILMKIGGNTGSIAVENKTFTFGISIISAIGFICYIGSFLIFTKLVVMFNLSFIMPLTTGIVQILSLIASIVIFKEDYNWQVIVGVIMVVIGITLMNLKR